MFTVDTNFNPSDGQLITAFKSDGTYAFKTVEDILPDGTSATYQIIIFYINGEEYATFTGPGKGGAQFGDGAVFVTKHLNNLIIYDTICMR